MIFISPSRSRSRIAADSRHPIRVGRPDALIRIVRLLRTVHIRLIVEKLSEDSAEDATATQAPSRFAR
jgi:hypothetical protein